MWINSFFPWLSLNCTDKKDMRKLAKYENDLEFQNTFIHLLNLTANMIKVENLPETCNERYLKLVSIMTGKACLAKDPNLGFITLGVSNIGSDLNIYGEWSRVMCYGWNGWSNSYKNYMYGSDNSDAEAVVLWDNISMYPVMNYLIIYAKRLADIMRSLDVTAKKLKTPYVIESDVSQKAALKELLDAINENREAVFTTQATNLDNFKILQTNVNSSNLKDLWDCYVNIEANLKKILGIDGGTNLDKSERLLVDEVNANNNETASNFDTRLDNWQTWAKTCNDLWGLDIKVSKNVVDRMTKPTETKPETITEEQEAEDVTE